MIIILNKPIHGNIVKGETGCPPVCGTNATAPKGSGPPDAVRVFMEDVPELPAPGSTLAPATIPGNGQQVTSESSRLYATELMTLAPRKSPSVPHMTFTSPSATSTLQNTIHTVVTSSEGSVLDANLTNNLSGAGTRPEVDVTTIILMFLIMYFYLMG